MKSVDSADLWFGAVFGVVAAGVFALAAIVLWDTAKNSTTFWPNMLAMFGVSVVVAALRGPVERMRRAWRFLFWVGFGTAVFALAGLIRGEAFSPAMAFTIGLAWAVLDWLAEYLRARREATGE